MQMRAAVIEVTGGNVRNAHVYLRELISFFPADAVGGSHAGASGATVELSLGSERVNTDIDGKKLIFRERGALRRFFEREAVLEGDLLVLKRTSPRVYELSKTSRRAFDLYL